MGGNQILDLLRQLPYLEQLTIVEAILRAMLEREKGSSKFDVSDEKLSIAAEALYEDYERDAELTIFTKIDGC